MKNTVIDLGAKREMFWDDYLVETGMTTAQNRMMEPVALGTVLHLGEHVEASSISYPCIVKDDQGYRMYYIGWNHNESTGDQERANSGSLSHACVLLSKDGINWTRPNLGIHEENGSKNNNIVLGAEDFRDNAFFFYDTNPACPPEQKYKCLCDGLQEGPERTVPGMKRGLWYYYSADGFRWNRHGIVSLCGQFDTLNTAHWNGKQYVAYIRNYHKINMEGVTGKCTVDGVIDINDHYAPPGHKNSGVRDVRVMYSDDFINWTTPERIQFNDGQDMSLYTNNIIPCARAPHILMGMPTRYNERPAWTPNYDQLPSPDERRYVIQRYEKRAGLAITDCMFMWSRDGINWDRFDQAFLTPGYERPSGWVYGDCYPSYGFVDNGDENLYFYTIDYHHNEFEPKPVNRYKIRKDGFGCYMAGGKEETLVTKPLVFEGSTLHLNFATSAFGHIYADVLDGAGNPISGKSFEIFGDNIDRAVIFEDGTDFSAFAGKPVRLRFTMLDAKLFSLKFE